MTILKGQGKAAQERFEEEAFVYIAASRQLELIKIGFSKKSVHRADDLNRDGYGGASDWLILYERRFKRAGWVESQAHTGLEAFRSRRTYTRLGHGISVTAKELFACNYANSRAAVENMSDHSSGTRYERHDAKENFNFIR